MDSTMHLKRFFMEIHNDSSMYEAYLNGLISIDEEVYNKWYREMEIRNEVFADTISRFERLNSNTFVFESAICRNLTVSKHLFNKCRVEEASFGISKVVPKPLGESNEHYICNGYFEDTLENIYQVLTNGAFTVGICCEKKSELYERVSMYYNKVKEHLLKRGYRVSSIESSMSPKNKVYLLMYDSNKNGKLVRSRR